MRSLTPVNALVVLFPEPCFDRLSNHKLLIFSSKKPQTYSKVFITSKMKKNDLKRRRKFVV
jgi:hypothetical protein